MAPNQTAHDNGAPVLTNDQEAAAEVGWVAREANALADTPSLTAPLEERAAYQRRLNAYLKRKRALLVYIDARGTNA